MTIATNKARPAWSIHPPDIRRALKTAISRCYALIGVARRDGNQQVVDAFTLVLNKIKDADQAARDARAIYGWESTSEKEGPVTDVARRNPCCGNTGTQLNRAKAEGGREYCSTCGQEIA